MGKGIGMRPIEGWEGIFQTRIKERAKREGWNVADLAQHTGLDYHIAWNCLEKDGYAPSVQTVMVLAETLDLSICFLLGTEDGCRGAGVRRDVDLGHLPCDMAEFLTNRGVFPYVHVARQMYERGLNGAVLDSVIAHLEELRGFLRGLRPPSTNRRTDETDRSDDSS